MGRGLRALGAVECVGGSFLFPLWQSLEPGLPVQPALQSPLHAPLPLFLPWRYFCPILFWPRPSLNINNEHFIDEHFIGWAFDQEPHFCQYQWFQVLGFLGQIWSISPWKGDQRGLECHMRGITWGSLPPREFGFPKPRFDFSTWDEDLRTWAWSRECLWSSAQLLSHWDAEQFQSGHSLSWSWGLGVGKML